MALLTSENLPVTSDADVLAEFPRDVREVDVAPVRDAIVSALTVMYQTLQDKADYAADNTDILSAIDIYLEALGEDRGVSKSVGETQEQYRARILSVPELVTPNAIIDAVTRIISSYTTTPVAWFEAALDQWFALDGNPSTWRVYIEAEPDYPERDVLPNFGVGGARVFGDSYGRHFCLRIPSLTGTDSQHQFVWGGATTNTDDRWYCIDGVSPTPFTFIFGDRKLSTELYNAIISAVNSIKGQGIRWTLFVE